MPLINTEQLKTMIKTPVDLRTNDAVRNFFSALALKHLLGSDYETVVQDMIDAIPQAPVVLPQPVLFGRQLGTYQGLSRSQIKDKFGLSDGNVDTIFAAAGIVE